MKSVVILAGGKSSRMGRDKVLLELDGKTFIERIFFNALECFEHVIISTDSEDHAKAIRELPAFADTSFEIVTDHYKEAGPAGGICSVFESSDVHRFSIISVDVPFCNMRVLEALYDRCSKKAAYLQIGSGRPEPLIAAYDRSAYAHIKKSLDAGLYKLRMAVPDTEIDIVTDAELKEEFPELAALNFENAFSNFNTPEEYSEMSQKGSTF